MFLISIMFALTCLICSIFININWIIFNKKECIKKEKDVTVLIPVYNAKDTILETIKSIQNQKYCGDIYINVIDDGSTDGSLELVKSTDFDSNITLIESHNGKAFALNKGLEKGKNRLCYYNR